MRMAGLAPVLNPVQQPGGNSLEVISCISQRSHQNLATIAIDGAMVFRATFSGVMQAQAGGWRISPFWFDLVPASKSWR